MYCNPPGGGVRAWGPQPAEPAGASQRSSVARHYIRWMSAWTVMEETVQEETVQEETVQEETVRW